MDNSLLEQYGNYICELLSDDTKYLMLKEFQKDKDLMEAMSEYEFDEQNHNINDFVDYHIKEVFYHLNSSFIHTILKRAKVIGKDDDEDEKITNVYMSDEEANLYPPFRYKY